MIMLTNFRAFGISERANSRVQSPDVPLGLIATTASNSIPGRSGLEAGTAADDARDAIVLPMKELRLGAESTSATSAAKEDLLREEEGRSSAGSYICSTRSLFNKKQSNRNGNLL